MSIEHSPPSTYILRELHDVTVPDSVSWMPQTIGWKILTVGLLILAVFLVYRRLQTWWQNRYRTEAIGAINNLNLNDQSFEDSLYSIVKIVLVYLDPANGKLFGTSLLRQIDCLGDGKDTFDGVLGQKWTQSLVDPATVLNTDERASLQQKVLNWMMVHQSQKKLRISKGEGRHV
ncbi:DUF4381 domain-containing protein [Photobacterium sp. BZF1]|uniref:DUF4381 domain-containing protein n=1 Tax=Photobacterium sp. BZF1 TaxID=1904457 RepID=UPI0016534F5C|nr:DUF4381 domain-containing protein [Photobacterium sp. BZF1]MBC7002323.1 DUF4381 domain-containing protein [Photobacterium sp. BZF1]